MTNIEKSENGYAVTIDGRPYARILPCEGATDTFEPIEDGAWKWHRHTDVPTDHMRMEMLLLGAPTFTMVPAVSYNGNGWGKLPEYVGDRAEDGTPWSWASHRVTIPSCTYSENEAISLALMAEANDNNACSLYRVDEGELHAVIFPEEEQPKTLQRHFWGDPFRGTMEPRCDFTAIILAAPSDGGMHRYKCLLDFAWRYYGHEIAAPMTTDELYRLGIAYCRYLFCRERNGFVGFSGGAQWYMGESTYKKNSHRYGLGWVGQSASMANAFIWDYLRTGDTEKLDIAIEAHDAWLRFGKYEAGHLAANIDFGDWRYMEFPADFVPDRWSIGECTYESYKNYPGKKFRRAPDGQILLQNDACNLGTGADCYFEAYDLLQKAGIDKPEYLQTAYDICDFALRHQDADGMFAKSWDEQGNVLAKKGTVGCFLVLPIITA